MRSSSRCCAGGPPTRAASSPRMAPCARASLVQTTSASPSPCYSASAPTARAPKRSSCSGCARGSPCSRDGTPCAIVRRAPAPHGPRLHNGPAGVLGCATPGADSALLPRAPGQHWVPSAALSGDQHGPGATESEPLAAGGRTLLAMRRRLCGRRNLSRGLSRQARATALRQPVASV
eukprot:3646922-Prymnesium_polylepis.1